MQKIEDSRIYTNITKNKRIAFNAVSAIQGGGQVYLFNILRYAKNFPDLEIYVFSLPEFAHLYKFSGIEVISCGFYVKNILFRMIWEKLFLPVILKKLKIELVFCPGGILNFLPPKGCRTAITFQNMLILDRNSRRKYPFGYMRFRLRLLERLTRKSFKKADLIIFISNYAKGAAIKQLLGVRGKIVVIPHGLDDKFRISNTIKMVRPDFLPDDDYLLYVSNIDVYKAQIEVVWAYHQLCQRRHTKEKLLLVGPENYSPYGERVRREIRRMGLGNRVIMLNEIAYERMSAVYQHAKANIFASVCENCPNIVLESLASGKPLFLSKVPPMPEFAQDAAVYFDPYKPNELADLLLRYLDDEEWMKKMGKLALERSLNYRWDETATKTFQSFRNMF